MPEAPPQTDASSTTHHRLDWLAIAPWTLLFRVPSIALGRPFLLGAIGALFLGIYPKEVTFASYSLTEIYAYCLQYARHLVQLPAQLIRQFADPQNWQDFFLSSLGFVGWAVLAFAIIEHASRALTQNSNQGFFQLLRNAIFQLPKLIGVCLLALAATLPFALLLMFVGWVMQFDWAAKGFFYAWPLISIGLGIPVYLLLTGLIMFSPFAMASIVVDRADMFDAASRMYAYAYQNLLRILGYVGLALLLGLISFYLMVTLLTGTNLVLNELLGDKSQQMWLQTLIHKLPLGYACGFFYSAASAIYLLSRRDVDDQPLDEMVS